MIRRALGAACIAAWVLAGLISVGTAGLLLRLAFYVHPNGMARASWAFAGAVAFIGIVHWLVALAVGRLKPGALGPAMAVTAGVFFVASWSAFGGLLISRA